MKIKKVDDKPMDIHTKEKVKIHTYEVKAAKIKGSNIYTVERGTKTAGAKVKKRIKKVEAGKKMAKKTAKKVAKDTAKTVAKETAKETAKTTAKVAAKTATKSAVALGVGTAVGIAAGYAAGVSIEAKDAKATNRSRKIKFSLDNMKAQENQTALLSW